MNARRITLILVAVLAAVIVFAEPAAAQCAMCKTAVESSSDVASGARALNLAVLVLLVPPVAIFAGVFGVFYRYRNVQGGKRGEDNS